MVTAEELNEIPIFACLEEPERQRMARKAADVRLKEGEFLIQEGETPSFFVLLEGELKMVKDLFGRADELGRYASKDFFGEVPILMGAPSLVSMKALTPCRVARFDRQQLQELIRDSAACSAIILQTMNQRLMKVQKFATATPSARVLIVGTRYDSDCQDIRSFLAANRISFEWVDRDRDAERIPSCMPPDLTGPAVVVDRAKWLCSPTVRDVADALGLQTAPRSDTYDVVVVGAGPAGMAAGVYGASEGLKVLMVERSAAGGQAGTSSRIENYLGFPEGISGDELSGRAVKQALRFGAEIAMTREVEKLTPIEGGYCLELDGGQRVSTRSVVMATGVDWRRLDVPNVDRLRGRGVLYGASRNEAHNVNGKRVLIVGGGNSAGQAAVFFSSYAAKVVLVIRGRDLKLSMSQYLIGQLKTKSNIYKVPFTEVVGVEGDDHLERVTVRTRVEGGTEERFSTHDVDAMFVMIGADASTDWLPDSVERDERGYVCTGRDLSKWSLEREAFPLETSLPGVFCAGDVRHASIKRVSSGVGEGSMAIAFIHQYLAMTAPELAAI